MGEGGHLNLCWRVEEACLNAWPSPRQVVHGDWLIRMAGGARRRTNAVNPTRAESHDPLAVIDEAQALYRAQGQPTLFRAPSIARGIEAPLNRLGYQFAGETCVLFADLRGMPTDWDVGVELTTRPTGEWLQAQARMTPLAEADQWVFEAMLGSLITPRAFAAVRQDGQIVSAAYGVIHGGLLVVEAVITDAAHRQRGFARQALAKLIAWARGQAASGAAIEVRSDNAAARRLYQGAGFDRELYRGLYLAEPAPRSASRGETTIHAAPIAKPQ